MDVIAVSNEHASFAEKGLDEARGDEKFFDAQEFSSSNKDVANILDQNKVTENAKQQPA
jgi:hypothetical protein